MKVKIGVMGSAAEASSAEVQAKAVDLGRAIARRGAIILTGATTGLVYTTGKAAHDAGAWHLGISPAADEREHVERYKLPTDACDAIIYTGFGLKGRNVVLVRSADIAIFIAGSMGSLNEFTIAYDEGRVIGCLRGTGGVADEVEGLTETFRKRTHSHLFYESDPERLLDVCFGALRKE